MFTRAFVLSSILRRPGYNVKHLSLQRNAINKRNYFISKKPTSFIEFPSHQNPKKPTIECKFIVLKYIRIYNSNDIF